MPLAVLDLHLKRRLPTLPPRHFILRDSRYEVTGIDITSVWPEYAAADHPTVIQLVAGDTVEIRYLSDVAFKERLIGEVRRYFPFDRSDVDDEHTVAMKHLDAAPVRQQRGLDLDARSSRPLLASPRPTT